MFMEFLRTFLVKYQISKNLGSKYAFSDILLTIDLFQTRSLPPGGKVFAFLCLICHSWHPWRCVALVELCQPSRGFCLALTLDSADAASPM